MSAVTLTSASDSASDSGASDSASGDSGGLLAGLPGARELLGLCRDLAAGLRSLALAVDGDPFGLDLLRDSTALDELRRIATPAPYRDGAVPWFAE